MNWFCKKDPAGLWVNILYLLPSRELEGLSKDISRMFRRNRLSPDVYIYFFRLGLLFPCFLRREGRVQRYADDTISIPFDKNPRICLSMDLSQKRSLSRTKRREIISEDILFAPRMRSCRPRVGLRIHSIETAISSRHYFPFDRNSIPPIIP